MGDLQLVILGMHDCVDVSETEQSHFFDVYDRLPFYSLLLLSFRVLHMWLHLYLKA